MTTSVVNVKVDSRVKKKAMKAAQELGLNLSSVINGYLRDFIQVKSILYGKKVSNIKESPFGIFSGAEITQKDLDEVTSLWGKNLDDLT